MRRAKARPTRLPLARDRAVDETGGQVAVLGRVGARPLNEAEMRDFYLDANGKPWFVDDKVEGPKGITSPVQPYRNNRTLEQQRAEAKAAPMPAGSSH